MRRPAAHLGRARPGRLRGGVRPGGGGGPARGGRSARPPPSSSRRGRSGSPTRASAATGTSEAKRRPRDRLRCRPDAPTGHPRGLLATLATALAFPGVASAVRLTLVAGGFDNITQVTAPRRGDAAPDALRRRAGGPDLEARRWAPHALPRHHQPDRQHGGERGLLGLAFDPAVPVEPLHLHQLHEQQRRHAGRALHRESCAHRGEREHAQPADRRSTSPPRTTTAGGSSSRPTAGSSPPRATAAGAATPAAARRTSGAATASS